MPELQATSLRGFFPIEAVKAGDGDGDETWYLIVPTGEWAGHNFPIEGILRITPGDVQIMAEHFEAGIPPMKIAVDFNHQPGPAAGWVEKVRADERGLWATIDWTTRGEQAVADREYRYFSPEWNPDQMPYVRPTTGEKVAQVLVGVAVTNRPFFEGELPVAASKDGSGWIAVRRTDSHTAQGDGHMADDPKPNDGSQDPQQDPAQTGDGQETIESLKAERDAAMEQARKAEEKATTAEQKAGNLADDQRRTQIREQLAAVKAGDRKLSAAHVDKHVDQIMALPDEQRDAHLDSLVATLQEGLVEIGERGSSDDGSGRPTISAEQRKINERMGVSDEDYLAANPEG